jgi:BMFP domain-containing protein YqiC
MPEDCQEQEKLRQAVTDVLNRMDVLNRAQIEAIKTRDDERLMALDKELEAAFGQKQRLYGALFEHRNQHGC